MFGSAERVAHGRGRSRDPPEAIGSLVEQFPGGVDSRAQGNEVEPASDRHAPHTGRGELGDRRNVREREDVDREIDRGNDGADVVDVV